MAIRARLAPKGGKRYRARNAKRPRVQTTEGKKRSTTAIASAKRNQCPNEPVHNAAVGLRSHLSRLYQEVSDLKIQCDAVLAACKRFEDQTSGSRSILDSRVLEEDIAAWLQGLT